MNKYKAILTPNNQSDYLLGYVEAKNKGLALRKIIKEYGLSKTDDVCIVRVSSEEYDIHFRLELFDAMTKKIRERIEYGALIPNLNILKQI